MASLRVTCGQSKTGWKVPPHSQQSTSAGAWYLVPQNPTSGQKIQQSVPQ